MRLLAFLLLLVVSPAQSAESAPDAAPVLLVLGDSLSAGYGLPAREAWPSLLAHRLGEQGYRYRVVNASVSGETTAGGLRRAGPLLERHRPKVLVLELGANDGLRGLSAALARENLAAIIRQSRQAGARVLLVGVRLPPNYGAAFNAAYGDMYASLARETGVAFAPRMLEGFAADPALFQADGLHPRAIAQPLIIDNLWPALETLLRD